MKNHTGVVFILGKGCINGDSTKERVNARNATESELQGVDDKIAKPLWVKKLIEH